MTSQIKEEKRMEIIERIEGRERRNILAILYRAKYINRNYLSAGEPRVLCTLLIL